MATVMPLEEVATDQTEEEGGDYHPQEAEKQNKNTSTGDHLHDRDNKERDARSKSPPPSADGKYSKKEIECKVFLLNGDVMTVTVDRKIKTADLLERVHTEVDVYEKDYFALYFIENNQKIFLNAHKPVKDQVPSGMRNAWNLRYGVKFYLSDPSMLKEDVTRYLFCLQLCQDIKENRVLIDRETSTILTALMLQANLGDYDPSEHKEGYSKAFTDFILLPIEELSDNYESQLVDVHKAKAGYTPNQAESEFMQITKKLLRYGMHLFAVKDLSSAVVLVGLSYRGISIFRDHIETAKYPWPNINKIAYKRHKFIIRHRLNGSMDNLANESSLEDPMGARGSGNIHVVKLYTGAAPNAKRIWKCAVEQHTFFRLQIPERPSRIQQVFRRGTKFRYSGRTLKQLQKVTESREEPKLTRTHSERLRENPRKQFAPGYVPARNSFKVKKPVATRQFVVGKQEDHDKSDWVLLEAPPFIKDNNTGESFEEQLVQVKFRVKDGLPNMQHKFVIVKKDDKYQMERVGAKREDQVDSDDQPTFNLTKINPKAISNTTHISIKLEPKPISVAPRGSVAKDAIPIYDSTKIPDVDLRQSGPMDDVHDVAAFRSVSNGPIAKGAVLRQYPEEQIWPLRFNAPTDEEDEASQVQAFLDREKEIISQVLLKQEGED